MAKASVKQRAAKSARPTKSTAAKKPAASKSAVASKPKSAPAPRTAAKKPVAKSKSPAKAKPAAKPPAKTAKPVAPVAKSAPAKSPPAKPVVAAKSVKPVVAKAAAPVNGTHAAAAAPEAPKSGGFRLSQGPFVGSSLTKKGTFAPNKLVVPAPKLKRVERPAVAVAPPPPPPAPVVATSEKAQKNRAGLGQRDLEFFRDLLFAKRRELLGDMSSMEREALREGTSDLSTLPIHMADQGTDAYEQEFTLGLVEKDRTLLREINNALAKIQNGNYGICEGTGLPISKPRLEAQPWAKYSIEHARALEKRQMTFRR